MRRWGGRLLLAYERFLEFARLRPVAYRVVIVEEAPDDIKSCRLYAVGGEIPWLAVMGCPCGCGAEIHLSLLDTDSPHWTLKWNRTKKPSLYPSVWRTKDCKSHFFLKEGFIRWC